MEKRHAKTRGAFLLESLRGKIARKQYLRVRAYSHGKAPRKSCKENLHGRPIGSSKKKRRGLHWNGKKICARAHTPFRQPHPTPKSSHGMGLFCSRARIGRCGVGNAWLPGWVNYAPFCLGRAYRAIWALIGHYRGWAWGAYG